MTAAQQGEHLTETLDVHLQCQFLSPLLADISAFDVFADASTKNPCPPCSSQATSEYITNTGCPGPTAREGDINSERTLCKGCCYEVQDPGPMGTGGRNAGNYVNADSGKICTCKYTFTVSWPGLLYLHNDDDVREIGIPTPRIGQET